MNHELPACMGGFCSHRSHCAQYHAENRQHVVERLCERGQEHPMPIDITRLERSTA